MHRRTQGIALAIGSVLIAMPWSACWPAGTASLPVYYRAVYSPRQCSLFTALSESTGTTQSLPAQSHSFAITAMSHENQSITYIKTAAISLHSVAKQSFPHRPLKVAVSQPSGFINPGVYKPNHGKGTRNRILAQSHRPGRMSRPGLLTFRFRTCLMIFFSGSGGLDLLIGGVY